MSGRKRQKRNRHLIVWRRWGDWRKLAVAIGTGGLIALLLITPSARDQVTLSVGEQAREEVRSPRYVQYLDEAETRRQQDLVRASIPPRHATILGAAGRVEREIGRFFEQVQRLQASEDPLEQRAEQLLEFAPPGFTGELARAALQIPPERLTEVANHARSLALEEMSRPLRDDTGDLAEARDQIHRQVAALRLPLPERELVAETAALSLVPNMRYSAEATAEARDRAAREVAPVRVELLPGEVIIRRGETVTEEHLALLERLGLRQPRMPPQMQLSLVLLGFGLVALFGSYLYQFHLRTFRELRALVLLAVVTLFCLTLFRLGGAALEIVLPPGQLGAVGYLGVTCAALAAMLIAALLNPQVAVFVGMAMAFVTALLVDNQLKFAFVALVSSMAAVQAVANIRDRQAILRAALTVSTVNVVAILVIHGATARYTLEELGVGAIWGVGGGLASVFLFVPVAALLERPFRLTTHLKLLELSDPNHPLLRRLAMEAPGTYAHSIAVGNLSEAAAKAIGADSLFCRVASYYHDIGKVIRPQFFVENQTSENRHTQINPSLSCLIITAHVKDGVQMAEEQRLPPPIIDIIREHHGTCLIKYFYHRAVTGGEEPVPSLEYQFRYEGPRPSTKESGIIMLADAAEAASRTLEKPTPGRIRSLIETIVRDRLTDGQLDECELTFKDLDKIVGAFTRTLSSLLHARIEYPEGKTSDLLRVGADGTTVKQPAAPLRALSDTPETAAGTFGESSGT